MDCFIDPCETCGPVTGGFVPLNLLFFQPEPFGELFGSRSTTLSMLRRRHCRIIRHTRKYLQPPNSLRIEDSADSLSVWLA